jgi:phosphatidylserine decarboxylase
VCVADSRLVVYPSVQEAHRLWIKGHSFTIAELLKSEELAAPWKDGPVASFRLSPQDYHRYHSPVKGRTLWWKQMDGTYYLVDPIAVRSDVDILTANARTAFAMESEEFGKGWSC